MLDVIGARCSCLPAAFPVASMCLLGASTCSMAMKHLEPSFQGAGYPAVTVLSGPYILLSTALLLGRIPALACRLQTCEAV